MLLLKDRVRENNVEMSDVDYQIDLLKDKIEIAEATYVNFRKEN